MKPCKVHNVCLNQDVSEYLPKTSLFSKKMHETTLKTIKKRSVKLAKMLWHHNTKLKACLSLSKYWNKRMMNGMPRGNESFLWKSCPWFYGGFMHSNLGSCPCWFLGPYHVLEHLLGCSYSLDPFFLFCKTLLFS